jgi:acetyl esterase/lipase
MTHTSANLFRLPVLLAVATSIALCQSSPIVASGTSFKTFTYKRIENIDVHADVYRLQGNNPRPVILWLHGGGLIFGNRGALPADEREQLLQAGYVVVAIDYRLGPETKLPEILKDVEDAYRWIQEKGPTLFSADPRRVAIVGQSAGAYLALMAGVRVHPSPKAIISFYGYGDIAGDWYSRPSAFFLSEQRVTKKEAFRAVSNRVLSESPLLPRYEFYVFCRQNGRWPQEIAGLDPLSQSEQLSNLSPERLVGPHYPPTFLLHGDRDTDVPYEMSERMAAVLQQQGVEHRLLKMEGFNHMFDVFPDGLPPEGKPVGLRNRKVAAAFQDVLGFLSRFLGPIRQN